MGLHHGCIAADIGAYAAISVHETARVELLDGDLTLEERIPPKISDTEAALPQHLSDPVALPENCADGKLVRLIL